MWRDQQLNTERVTAWNGVLTRVPITQHNINWYKIYNNLSNSPYPTHCVTSDTSTFLSLKRKRKNKIHDVTIINTSSSRERSRTRRATSETDAHDVTHLTLAQSDSRDSEGLVSLEWLVLKRGRRSRSTRERRESQNAATARVLRSNVLRLQQRNCSTLSCIIALYGLYFTKNITMI